ncbi:uncharacterized protein LOC126263293 [Schistocerca nitens]|uniref:uncharacterized protein LOC126263293 n=1 Tax=Schistocerca nitens TaxID=7011 RepID=UPI00211911A4|nr:uncharacterized protein LOC126263293 [Schistocerca nitens]
MAIGRRRSWRFVACPRVAVSGPRAPVGVCFSSRLRTAPLCAVSGIGQREFAETNTLLLHGQFQVAADDAANGNYHRNMKVFDPWIIAECSRLLPRDIPLDPYHLLRTRRLWSGVGEENHSSSPGKLSPQEEK